MIDFAKWFVHSLTGSPDTVIDWRCIHDKDKGAQGVNLRGTVDELWSTLQKYNEDGYGIFCNISAMEDTKNVAHIRAHVVDLDNPLTSEANFARAASGTFAVQTSPGKYHVYWRVQPYTGNEFFTNIQRKLAQLYDGDKSIIDATRVMRVPGFMHQKREAYLVTGMNLTGAIYTFEQMSEMLAAVNVFDHISTRSALGTPEMSAPSLEWLKYAMALVNPNEMDRLEWLSLSAAIKQAGWLHADEEQLYNLWSEWCGQYADNDDSENRKLWNSISDTEVGWKSIERKTTVKAYMDFGFAQPPAAPRSSAPGEPLTPPVKHEFGEILSEYECQQYFKDCYYINRSGEIFTPQGRFMKSGQFNGMYGGKQFIITSTGKCTDEAWKAVTRSTLWTIPKVDHVRFLPDRATFEIIEDDLGRKGLNTYIPIKPNQKDGDATPWLQHMDKILPNKNDQRLLFEYMAHCVKFPGFKIPWSPMLQSAEGIGKSAFTMIMSHALGQMYVYSPKAPELVSSGSTFNAWMRGKLMIMVDEIKIDERRELIEILKPMITDARVEIQSKGVDQDMEDNPANWFFFSNYKDAIPVNQNGRRYAIFYTVMQSEADILNAGMDHAYFSNFFDWLRADGCAIIAKWLHDYPIERGAIPVRAPMTSSQEEAIRISRSPMEIVISDCVQDGVSGFRGGYVSTIAVMQRCKAAGIRSPRIQSVTSCLENMGFLHLGRAEKTYMQEDISNRAEIFGTMSTLTVQGYAAAQGY